MKVPFVFLVVFLIVFNPAEVEQGVLDNLGHIAVLKYQSHFYSVVYSKLAIYLVF